MTGTCVGCIYQRNVAGAKVCRRYPGRMLAFPTGKPMLDGTPGFVFRELSPPAEDDHVDCGEYANKIVEHVDSNAGRRFTRFPPSFAKE